jgi:hypothetical protein
MMMIVEKSVECELAGEIEVLGENHMTWPGFEPEPLRGWKPVTNRLGCGTALVVIIIVLIIIHVAAVVVVVVE